MSEELLGAAVMDEEELDLRALRRILQTMVETVSRLTDGTADYEVREQGEYVQILLQWDQLLRGVAARDVRNSLRDVLTNMLRVLGPEELDLATHVLSSPEPEFTIDILAKTQILEPSRYSNQLTLGDKSYPDGSMVMYAGTSLNKWCANQPTGEPLRSRAGNVLYFPTPDDAADALLRLGLGPASIRGGT